MKIRFIGTGTMGSITRCNQSLAVDDILFDVGSGTVKKMESMKFYTSEINYMIISHFHADHLFDLPNYLIGRNIRKENSNVLPIIGGIGLKNRVIQLFYLAFGDGVPNKYDNFERDFNVRFIELKNGDIYEGKDFKITAYELEHGNCKPILGFILEKENKKIGYATDTELCDNLKKMCNLCDIICIDSTNIQTTRSHIGLEDVRKLKKENMKTRFFAIHRSDYVHTQINDIEFPEDGTTIEI